VGFIRSTVSCIHAYTHDVYRGSDTYVLAFMHTSHAHVCPELLGHRHAKSMYNIYKCVSYHVYPRCSHIRGCSGKRAYQETYIPTICDACIHVHMTMLSPEEGGVERGLLRQLRTRASDIDLRSKQNKYERALQKEQV
jgi:hypothetical protein